MAFDIEEIKAIVKNYADDVRQLMPVVKVFLYGSYAKGTATERSDVDVCFFLTHLDYNNWLELMKILFRLTYKYEIYIELNLFELSDLEDNDDPFIVEVLRTGIEVH
jgi:predicted nucleotidyltransferase